MVDVKWLKISLLGFAFNKGEGKTHRMERSHQSDENLLRGKNTVTDLHAEPEANEVSVIIHRYKNEIGRKTNSCVHLCVCYDH